MTHEQRLHDWEEHPERYCADTADDGSPCLQPAALPAGGGEGE